MAYGVPTTTNLLAIEYRKGVGLLFERGQDLKLQHHKTALYLPETRSIEIDPEEITLFAHSGCHIEVVCDLAIISRLQG